MAWVLTEDLCGVNRTRDERVLRSHLVSLRIVFVSTMLGSLDLVDLAMKHLNLSSPRCCAALTVLWNFWRMGERAVMMVQAGVVSASLRWVHSIDAGLIKK